jgi:hypothetical protein
VSFYTKGEHTANHADRQPCYYGISENVKEILEDLIYNYDSRPIRLHIQLEKLKRTNKVEIDRMPTLKQVQNYVNNRRRRLGDYNNIDELKKIVADLDYDDGVTEDHELFTFGEKFGDGDENNHFQLGDFIFKIYQY